MTFTQRIATRSHRSIAFSALLLITACGGMAGCAADPKAPPPSKPVGTPDQPKTARLVVDEAGITGQVTAGVMRLQIPVSNPGAEGSSGSLTVAIVGVDGATIAETQKVPFQIGPGTSSTLPVDFQAITEVANQADWVKYNVFITSPEVTDLQVTRSLLTALGNYEVRIEGPTTVTRGRQASYRVRTQNPVTNQVRSGEPVQLIVRQGDVVVLTQDGTTGDKGDAEFDVVLDIEGAVTVEARATMQGTSVNVSDSATVKLPGNRVLLTTDKPIYQPGQTIHLRALALENLSKKPLSGQPVLFEIEDGKANKILKRTLTSDSYGLAATQFKLGQVLNLGSFKVRVTVGADISEKTVEVSRYALPKFKVQVTTDKPWYTPGAVVSGAVDANYFFGKALDGADVQIEAATMDIGLSVFQKVIGKTDAQGRYTYSVKLPAQLVGLPINDSNAAINLRVQVTDTAGQQVVQEQTVTVASKTLRIALVPEGTAIVPGLDNHIDVFVTDPLGSPTADAAVEVSAAGTLLAGSGRSDAFGHFSFTWNPAAGGPTQVTVKVTGKDGASVSETFSLKNQGGTAPLLVRTDRAVYSVGDTVAVDVITSKDENTVYIDWSNNGQTVDMRTLDVTGGTASFKATLDTSHAGTNRIDAYIVGADGNIVRTGRTIFVRGQGALSVEMTTDKAQYQPGQPAQITFSIKDETGAPAVAALGVQVVDEAVFALVDARPGLLRTYFELEEQFAQPSYEIRPPVVDLESLLYNETAASDPATASAAQNRAAAVFASLGDGGITGMRRGSWAALSPEVKTQLQPYYLAAKQRLLPIVSQATVAAIDALKQAGCDPSTYYCSAKDEAFYSLLQAEVSRRLTGWVFDFWGNPYRSQGQYMEVVTLLTSGPDEKPDTDDDGSISFAITELDLPAATKSDLGMGYGPHAADGGMAFAADASAALPPAFTSPAFDNGGGFPGAAGGAMAAAGGAPGTISIGTSTATATGTSSGDEPRVRKDFPETLYVNPQLITGSDGKASISVDMADSITQWRVSSLAHTMGGKMGGGVGAIRVFQEFFVDIDFPATLTRGDEVSFPVAVYNYLDTAQTVRVEMQPADWFTPLGGTGIDIDLGPGQVTGVRFPVRVDQVGRQTMTVKGTSAMARVGLMVGRVQNGCAHDRAVLGEHVRRVLSMSASSGL